MTFLSYYKSKFFYSKSGNAPVVLCKLSPSTFVKQLYGHLVTYGTPLNLNWFWSFGSMSGVLLTLQIVTGILISMHYHPDASEAFQCVQYFTLNVPNGNFLKYLHANGASTFFILVYLHIAKALFYGSYFKPRQFVWYVGIVIFILMMGTAFIGYVLPWGQMSLWGATVITSLLSAIPKIGTDLCYFVWGGYTVASPTLNRFYSLHFLLPFVIVGLAMLHLILLHAAGSNNTRGADVTRWINFFPSYGVKDFTALIVTGIFLSLVLALHPDAFGHPDNDLIADSYVTPKHIVPEWYFLPFYAILRSVPNKLGGVIAMFFSLISLFFLPSVNYSQIRNTAFRPLYAFFLFVFILNLFFLGWIGNLPPEAPFVQAGLIATIYYFLFIFVITPFCGITENILLSKHK